jgi:hypothetical protein
MELVAAKQSCGAKLVRTQTHTLPRYITGPTANHGRLAGKKGIRSILWLPHKIGPAVSRVSIRVWTIDSVSLNVGDFSIEIKHDE